MRYANKPLPKKSAVVATMITNKQGKREIGWLHLVNSAGIVECDCHIHPTSAIFAEEIKITEKIRRSLCPTHRKRTLKHETA